MNKKFSNVLIASDLDGTLLGTDQKVSSENRAAIEYFIENGGYFTVCTGRPYQSFKLKLPMIPLNAPVILVNGSLIYDYEKEKILFEDFVDNSALEAVKLALARFPGLCAEIYRFNESYIVRMNQASKDHMSITGFEYSEPESPEEVKQPWTKVLFTDTPEELKEVDKYLRSLNLPVSLTFSSAHFYEMFGQGVNKGLTLLRLADMLSVRKEHVYAAGDQGNDIDMLKVAALGFAPENASDEVKELADVILPHCDKHTIAALIEYLDAKY